MMENLEHDPAFNAGELIDNILIIKMEIDEHKRHIQILQDRQKGLEEELIKHFKMNGTTMAAGQKGKASYDTKEIVSVTPAKWDDFFTFVFEKNATHLLHKRISQTPALELLHNGEEIPGAKIIETKKLSIKSK